MEQKQQIHNWDYKLSKNWLPETDLQWLWYLERKVNYGDWKGIKTAWLQKYLPKLEHRLDPGKREMLKFYLANHG